MSGYDAYKEYVALKNHFTKPEYDYIKYNGKIRGNPDSFHKRKDRIFFDKLAKHEDVHGYLLANLSDNPKHWIRDIAYSEDAERVYRDWLKKKQSLSYLFKQDLSKLQPNLYDNFLVKSGHPPLLRAYLGKEIMLETICILLSLFGAKKYWDKHMEYDPVWEEVSHKVQKYTPFIQFEKEKFKKIVLDFYGEI